MEVPLTWDIELSREKGQTKQKLRAKRRQKKKEQEPSRTLMRASVGPKTLRAYDKHWNALKQWSKQSISSDMSFKQMDNVLTQYLEYLYEQGMDLSVANYVTAAVIFHMPGSKGLASMPKSQMSMKGWRRLCPPRARMPVPYECVCLMATKAVEQKQQEVALVLLLNFALYLRPSELHRLRVQDIVRPIKKGRGNFRHYALLLHPTEVGIPSKTKQWDEMITLDLPQHQYLGPAMEKVLKLDKRPKAELAFRVTMTEVDTFMEQSWSALGLDPMGAPSLYRLRHGGASYESLHKLREMTAIQARGRWQSVKSLKNYEKGGRLQQLFGSLPRKVQQASADAAKRVSKLFLKLR